MRFFLSVFVISFYNIAFAALQPIMLTCEYQINPLGIDVKNPRLIWQFVLDKKNQIQTAYEIIVSDNPNDIKAFLGSQWVSGKIISNQNTHVEYNGKELKSFTQYFWRVRVYDQNGEASSWSEPTTFETAMLQQSDWKANWISDGSKQFARDEDFYQVFFINRIISHH